VTSQYGTIIGAVLVAVVIAIAASMVPIIGGFLGIFLAPMFVGVGYLIVRASRGQRVQVGSMWDPFKHYWPIVGIQFLVGLAAGVCYIPLFLVFVVIAFTGAMGGRPNDEFIILTVTIISVLVLGCTVASTYLTGRLGYSSYIYIDEASTGTSVDLFQAMKTSWNNTGPYAWKLVGLQLATSTIMLLTALLLIVGAFLIGYPLYTAALAAAYVTIFQIRGQDRCVVCGYDLRPTPGVVCPECGTMPPVG